MKLYHGTSERNLDSILKNGLTPATLNSNHHWESCCPQITDEGSVYLTPGFPIHHAVGSCYDGSKGIVLEIDSEHLDESSIYPDENFMLSRELIDLKWDKKKIRDKIINKKDMWKKSLQEFESISYDKPIDKKAIKRYCIIDWEKRRNMIDLVLNEFNFRKVKYPFARWLFNEDNCCETLSYLCLSREGILIKEVE